MPTCPNGHQSGSDDWCEVCGHRMADPGAGRAAPPPPPPPPPAYGYPGPGDPNATAQAELCPQCRTPREAMAPYCEECRYNFLTHTATSYTPLAPAPGPGGLNLPSGFTHEPPRAQPPPPPQSPAPHPGDPRHGGGPQHDPYDYQGSRPSQLNRPAEPLHDQSGRSGQPGQQSPFGAQGQQSSFPQGPGQHQPGQHQPGQHQQGGPPVFQQQSAPPAPPRQQPPEQQRHMEGADDWMLSPPSGSQTAPPHPQGPGPGHQQGGPPPYQQQSPPAPPPYGQQNLRPDPGRQQSAPPYRPAGGWTAVVGPDREYFLAMMQRSGPDATGLNLPAYSPEQHLPLTGTQITIGRRRQSTGEAPHIDLSVPPEDPGVSHQHAMLVQQPDGSWAVVDQNSTNGTTINGAEEPIQPYVPVPLNDGDRVHVGAWTTITIRHG
ncbi:FHA domain-containing protein [Streptomyces sp. NPDC055078]